MIPLLIGASFTSFVWSILEFIKIEHLGITGSISIPLIIITVILSALSKVSPYCVIDTKKNENNKKIIGWFLKGLAGVFIFGVIAIAIRKKIFGI
ncbi:hypothetical protein MUO66_02110 [Candidatus Bathyarchaeota archaeon]|nr:hypothetical protein [Candidatus Bathyarchaeota archaeon]